MNNEQLKLLIAEGEGLTVEFKEKYTSKIDRDIVALANSRGGFILLGVSDDGRITGEKLTNQLKAELSSLARNCDPHISITKITQIDDVVAIEVSEGLEKPYSCSSGYFRRLDGMTQKMTQKEVRLIFRAAADLSFESLPCKGFSFEAIQLGKVRTFLKEAGASLKVTGANLPAFLSSLGIHADNTINNAGALMFASDINRFIPHCETIMAAFKGVEKVHIYDRKDARTDLLTQFNDGMDFIRKQLNVRSEIYIDRKEIYEIPLDALREALINALVHRDYSMRGTSIYVNVFDDRVDISNPGGLLPGVTTRNFGKESVRRNPIIADLFHRMGKVERMGTGIKRMKDLMHEAGLKEPEFTSDTFFHAVFYRNPEYSLKLTREKKVGEAAQETTQETTQEKILALLKAHPAITRRELAAKIGITNDGIKYHLNKLKLSGRIKHIGPTKAGQWETLK